MAILPAGGTLPRILLVDDHLGNLIALDALIDPTQAKGVRAQSGREALAELERGEFALIVLDLHLPDMDGFEVARILRRKSGCKDLPIIFVSGADLSPETLDRAYSLGAVDFLSKPVAADAFRAKVSAFVEQYRHRIELERRVSEQSAEVRKEAAERRRGEEHLRLLTDLSPVLLGTTLDQDAILGALAEFAVPRFADWCAIHLLEPGGRIRGVALKHSDPGKIAVLREIYQRWPARTDAPYGHGYVLGTGKSQRLAEISDDLLRVATVSPEHLAAVKTFGGRSAVFVPLAVRGRLIGCLSLGTAASGRLYSEVDLSVAEEIGTRTALALDNASHYRESRETEARYRLLAAQTPAVQWTTDLDLRITMMVGNGLAETGKRPEQMIGMRIEELLPAGDVGVEAHRTALSGKSASFQNTFGGRRFECYCEPLRDEQGGVIGTVCIGSDRTERLAAEDTVRLLSDIGKTLASELSLEKLVQSTTDIATRVTGAQFGAFFYNVKNEKGESYALYTLSGVPREAFSKFPMPRNTAIFAPTFSGEGVVRSDDIRKDPRYGKNAPYHGMPAGHLPVVSYLAVPVLSRTGDVLGGLFFGHGEAGRFTPHHEALVSGISAYAAVAIENAKLFRRLEEELRDRKLAAELKSRLAAIIESTDDAVVSKTLDGIVSSWNSGAERLFGYTAKEMIGRSITTIIPEERLPEEREILDRIVRGQPTEHFETVRRRKDGSRVDVSLTVSPIKDAEGRVVGASKIARDITESKRTREEIRRMNVLLEERVQERTRSLQETVQELDSFAYTVAHDLRAPLRSIHSFGDILLEDCAPKLSGDEQKYLREMVAAGARMDNLISDLLNYSRLTRQDIPLAPVELGPVVDRVLQELKTELTERKAVVRVQGPLPAVEGCETLLGQVMNNLISNAVKFVERGTVPQVGIRAERIGPDRLRLLVEDNGIGIEKEYRDRLFRVFERLHTRDAYPGTGIGLAIVRRAAERMGGSAGFDSVPGKGSRFWIELRLPPSAP